MAILDLTIDVSHIGTEGLGSASLNELTDCVSPFWLNFQIKHTVTENVLFNQYNMKHIAKC